MNFAQSTHSTIGAGGVTSATTGGATGSTGVGAIGGTVATLACRFSTARPVIPASCIRASRALSELSGSIV